MPPTIEVNLTSYGNRYGLGYFGRSPRDVKARQTVSEWLSSHTDQAIVKRIVLVQGARGKVSYDARSGCHYWTIAQLDKLTSEVNQVIGNLGPKVTELEEKMTVDIERYNSLMPGEYESLSQTMSAQQTVKDLDDASRKLDEAQRLSSILAKVVRHGDTQVVVPHWSPSVGSVSILHKCGKEFPKELRDYLLEVVKTRGPLWTQFFWKALDDYPCPRHLYEEKCGEMLPAWEGQKPLPMPLHIQTLVKEMTTKSTNPKDWDTLHRGAFAWWQCIISWNFSNRKPVEKVEYPFGLGGRSVSKQNTLSGDQRLARKIDGAVHRALAPMQMALAELVRHIQDSRGGGQPVIKEDGTTTTLSPLSANEIEDRVAQIHDDYVTVSEEVKAEVLDEVSSSNSTKVADDSSNSEQEDITVHSYLGATWYVATSARELNFVLEPISGTDSVAELVMTVTPGHPAFPPNFQDFDKVWLVSMKRAYMPISFSPPLKVIPTALSQAEEVFNLSWAEDGSKVDVKEGKKKKQDDTPAPKASSPAKQTGKKSSSSGAGDDASGSGTKGASAPGGKKIPAIAKENPLQIQNAPKSAGLTDEQKVALKKALELPTDPIDQDVLANMTKEDRRKALAERSLPRWAVTAVLNNPSNLERIMKKELTKESFGKKTADRGTSAQLEWTSLRQKFPGVTLLQRPVSNKEKDLKKSWDSLVRKWGRDSPGLPKPKGSRSNSSADVSAENPRGRSRQRARADPKSDTAGIIDAVKLIGELARAFSGR